MKSEDVIKAHRYIENIKLVNHALTNRPPTDRSPINIAVATGAGSVIYIDIEQLDVVDLANRIVAFFKAKAEELGVRFEVEKSDDLSEGHAI